MASNATMAALTGRCSERREGQRNEQCERGFGPVCGRTEGVQPEDRNAGDRANVFGALFAVSQRPPKSRFNTREDKAM